MNMSFKRILFLVAMSVIFFADGAQESKKTKTKLSREERRKQKERKKKLDELGKMHEEYTITAQYFPQVLTESYKVQAAVRRGAMTHEEGDEYMRKFGERMRQKMLAEAQSSEAGHVSSIEEKESEAKSNGG